MQRNKPAGTDILKIDTSSIDIIITHLLEDRNISVDEITVAEEKIDQLKSLEQLSTEYDNNDFEKFLYTVVTKRIPDKSSLEQLHELKDDLKNTQSALVNKMQEYPREGFEKPGSKFTPKKHSDILVSRQLATWKLLKHIDKHPLPKWISVIKPYYRMDFKNQLQNLKTPTKGNNIKAYLEEDKLAGLINNNFKQFKAKHYTVLDSNITKLLIDKNCFTQLGEIVSSSEFVDAIQQVTIKHTNPPILGLDNIYFEKYVNKMKILLELIRLDSNQVNILNDDTIQSLINTNRLQFERAKNLTADDINFLKDKNVDSFITQDKLDPDFLLNLDKNVKQCIIEGSTCPEFLKYIKNQKISPTLVKDITIENVKFLSHPNAIELIRHDWSARFLLGLNENEKNSITAGFDFTCLDKDDLSFLDYRWCGFLDVKDLLINQHITFAMVRKKGGLTGLSDICNSILVDHFDGDLPGNSEEFIKKLVHKLSDDKQNMHVYERSVTTINKESITVTPLVEEGANDFLKEECKNHNREEHQNNQDNAAPLSSLSLKIENTAHNDEQSLLLATRQSYYVNENKKQTGWKVLVGLDVLAIFSGLITGGVGYVGASGFDFTFDKGFGRCQIFGTGLLGAGFIGFLGLAALCIYRRCTRNHEERVEENQDKNQSSSSILSHACKN
jgi:hypothetical protein